MKTLNHDMARDIPMTKEEAEKRGSKPRPTHAYLCPHCSGHAFYLMSLPEEGSTPRGYDYDGNELHGPIVCKSCTFGLSNLTRQNVVKLTQ